MGKKKYSSDGASADKEISDPRFASFTTDPRFRLPSKRQAKTKLDARFSRMLTDEDFTATATVDRYGRKLKSDSKKKALERLYEKEEEDDDAAVEKELKAADEKYDPARGGGFESSDDDDSDDDQVDLEEEEDEDVAGGASMQRLQEEQATVPTGEVTSRIAIVNMDWDNIKSADLFALLSSFAPAGGRIEKVAIYPSEFGRERMQQEELEGPPRELFKKEAKEDSDSESDSEDSESEEEDDDEEIKKQLLEEGDDQDFDSDALRSYQLDRLRYFYAVMTCDTKETAEKIYRDVDGREYLASSNFLDLRFVPDDVTFDDEARDECEGVPSGYKPVEFVTDALQHSKVKLTWDMTPDEVARKDQMQKAFTGSRNDIAENDLRAYLASDSEAEDDGDDEEVDDGVEVVDAAGDDQEAGADEEEKPKLSKKELARRKMREALGLKDDDGSSSKPSKGGPVGGMQVTFTPALTDKPGKSSGGKKGAEEEETTIEKYARKERERKEKKREKTRAKREGLDPDATPEEKDDAEETQEPTEDLGFNDPFFTTAEPEAPSKSSQRKEERLKKREAREAAEKESAAERAKLELLMADDSTPGEKSGSGGGKSSSKAKQHFDMKEIVKMEKRKMKAAKLKGKKAKKAAAEAEGGGSMLQEGFEMDVDDARFKAVFDDHEFAIDPSNPRFQATEGMKKLLEKGRNKRKDGGEDLVEEEGSKNKDKKKRPRDSGASEAGGGELAGLVESVKKKSKKH